MKQLKLIAVVMVIVGALVWIWQGLHPQPPNYETMPYIGLGQVVAQKAIAEVKGKAGHVVVVYVPRNSVQSQTILKSIQRTLAKHGNIEVTMNAFNSREVGLRNTISFQQLMTVVHEHANADVIILFLRARSFTKAQIRQLPHPSPKLIVFDWSRMNVERGIKAGLVVAAIMRKQRLGSLPDGHFEHGNGPRLWFDRYFQLITPDSNDGL